MKPLNYQVADAIVDLSRTNAFLKLEQRRYQEALERYRIANEEFLKARLNLETLITQVYNSLGSE